jgi:hypothetical protein
VQGDGPGTDDYEKTNHGFRIAKAGGKIKDENHKRLA